MVHVGGRTHTSQLYFLEDATRAVFTRTAFRDRPTPDTTNDTDEIYPTGGQPALLDVDQSGTGYLAAITLRLPEAPHSHA